MSHYQIPPSHKLEMAADRQDVFALKIRLAKPEQPGDRRLCQASQSNIRLFCSRVSVSDAGPIEWECFLLYHPQIEFLQLGDIE
jgi:hypothetical protein